LSAKPSTPSRTSTFDILPTTIPALRQMSRREIKVFQQRPYSLCLKQLAAVLDDDEQVETVTCALSTSCGPGVLVLTDRRLVLVTLITTITTRTGIRDWSLSGIDSARGRPVKLTLPAATYLDTPTGTLVIAVGDGPVWGPMFTQAVRRAPARRPFALAA